MDIKASGNMTYRFLNSDERGRVQQRCQLRYIVAHASDIKYRAISCSSFDLI